MINQTNYLAWQRCWYILLLLNLDFIMALDLHQMYIKDTLRSLGSKSTKSAMVFLLDNRRGPNASLL